MTDARGPERPSEGGIRDPRQREAGIRPASAEAGPQPPTIYLEPDDEITSAAARVRRATGERIAIVLPYGSHVATSRINFRLLAREAAAFGKRLEIVAGDPAARALAAAAGLPVHGSVAAFEGREEAGPGSAGLERLAAEAAGAGTAGAFAELTLPWTSPGSGSGPALPPPGAGDEATRRGPLVPREAPKVPIVGRPRQLLSGRAVVAILSVLALLLLVGGAVAYQALPSATISLTPMTDRLGPLDLVVTAQKGLASPDPNALAIPSQTFTFDAAATQTFPATGVKVSEAKATGSVRFSSFNTSNSTTIDAGSIVKTESGIAFKTLAAVTLPPATIDFTDPQNPVVVPSTGNVGIEASVVGPSGNVNNNTITVLPKGVNKNVIRVTNPDPTTGGLHEEGPQIAQADVDAAMAALDAAIRADFEAKVTAADGVPPGTTLFDDTKLLGAATPTVDPATLVGKDAADFELGLTAQGTVLGVDPAPVRGLAEARLRSRVPSGWRLLDDTIVISVGAPIVAGETISFPVTARARELREVDAAALVAQIKGLGLPEAKAILDDYGDVVVTLWPDWVTTIPTNTSRVTLTVEGGAGESAAPSGSGGASPDASDAGESAPAGSGASAAP
jgi:hypothetical protein